MGRRYQSEETNVGVACRPNAPASGTIDDMEDLIELRSAIERNGGKPGVPWEQAKAELDIDRHPRASGGKFASAHGSPAV
jgi:hypothetical protein